MASQIPALPQSYAPGTDSVFSDQSGFFSLDSNVPGLSKVILNKLNMKDYSEYRYKLQILTPYLLPITQPNFLFHFHNIHTDLLI